VAYAFWSARGTVIPPPRRAAAGSGEQRGLGRDFLQTIEGTSAPLMVKPAGDNFEDLIAPRPGNSINEAVVLS
jgi:hypothetical protein